MTIFNRVTLASATGFSVLPSGVSLAHADVPPSTITLPTQSFALSDEDASSTNLSFQKFDASLGTLTDVTFQFIDMFGLVTAGVSVVGIEGSGAFGTASANVTFTAKAPTATDPTGFSALGVLARGDTICLNLGADCTNSDSHLVVAFPSSVSPSPGSDLSAYTGAGTFDIVFGLDDLRYQVGKCKVGDCTATGGALFVGRAAVTYDYLAIPSVPEPGTLPLLAVGLGGLCPLARRSGSRPS
jgi:hypothetical protein